MWSYIKTKEIAEKVSFSIVLKGNAGQTKNDSLNHHMRKCIASANN